MNKILKWFILTTFAVIFNYYDIAAQSVLYSATANTPTTFTSTNATNTTITNALFFSGTFSSGGTCAAATRQVFTDTISYFNYDSLINLKSSAYLIFGVKANAGYKLQIDSITAQVASPVANLKFRIFYAVNSGKMVFVDSDFVVPQQTTCNASTVSTQRAGFNFIVPSSTPVKFYFIFYDAATSSEVDVYNVSLIGCVLPNDVNTDCNGAPGVWNLPPPINKYNLLYTENFSTADSTVATPFSNGNWSTRTYGNFGGLMADTNLYSQNGLLHIRYTYDGTNYVGSGIHSRKQFQYGYFETYMKPYVGASNFHQTFWVIGASNNSYYYLDSFPLNNVQIEIDGLQLESYLSLPYFKADNQFGFYHHHPSPLYTDAKNYGLFQPIGTAVGCDTGWVKVGFEWLPDSIKLYMKDTLRQIYLIPKSYYHHSAVAVEFSGLPTPKNYTTGIITHLSCPPGAEMLVDWFKYYAPINPPSNMDFISEGTFDYDTTSSDKHEPLCWINAYNHDINGFWLSTPYDTSATTVEKTVVHSGFAAVEQYNTTPYKTALRQNIFNVNNDKYTLTAWVRSSGGQKKCQMRVLTGGKLFTQNIVNTNGKWVKLVQPITVQNNSAVVEFYSDANAGNTLFIDDVSFIRNSSDTTLPVVFVEVKATSNTNGSNIEWKVANKENIASYTIERSLDGIHFEEIITTNAINAETYSVEDKQLLMISTPMYYRIKTMSNDGSSIYSSLAKLSTSHSPIITTLFPNPTKGLLKVIVNDSGKYNVKIFDATGRQIMTKTGLSPNGNTISLNVNNLTSGNYFLKLMNDKGIVYTGKFMKQ